MDNDYKYVGAKLRELSDLAKDGFIITDSVLTDLANKVDPLRPEPGTIVWWRATYSVAFNTWRLGEVDPEGIYAFATEACFKWDEVEWKPAHILKPGQVVVDRQVVKQAEQLLRGEGYTATAGYLTTAIDRSTEVER